MPLDARNWPSITEKLAAIVGVDHVLAGGDVSARFDGWPPIAPIRAACVVRPRTTQQVAAVMAYCNDAGIGVVPQGGRTGISGGARTTSQDIALSLERMTAIEAPQRLEATLTVEAGATLAAVQAAADSEGLLYPVDLGARGSATIGGTIATNAGGNRVLRFGMTREQVLGLEAVLADGTVVSSMNGMLKNNAGYDLKQLFIGSEGTLGIVTRAVLRLRPRFAATATAWVGTESFTQVIELLERLAECTDGALSSFEVMWPEVLDIALATGRYQRPLPARHSFHVLIEIAAREAEQLLEAAVSSAWEDGLIADGVVAKSLAQAAALWAIREDSASREVALKPAINFDVSLPRSAMIAYVAEVREALKARWREAKSVVFGHVADGNLHLTVSVGDDSVETRHAVDRIVYEPLRPLCGSISAEHGIGLDKREFLDITRTAAEIALMRRLKTALDPRNTLNPGKILGQPER